MVNNIPNPDKEKYTHKSIKCTRKQEAEIVFNYVFHGLSHRQLDAHVLGLDPKESRGFQSMSVLHNYGLGACFKGIFSGCSLDEVRTALENDLAFKDLVELLNIREIPPLVKSKRKGEFNKYSSFMIANVVYSYLFEGKTHRQIDRDVLGKDPKESKGFQSFAILNYMGLNGLFKGFFKGMSLDDSIEEIRADAYSEVSDCLKYWKEFDDARVKTTQYGHEMFHHQELLQNEFAQNGIEYHYINNNYGFIDYNEKYKAIVRRICKRSGVKSFNVISRFGKPVWRIHIETPMQDQITKVGQAALEKLERRPSTLIDNDRTTTNLHSHQDTAVTLVEESPSTACATPSLRHEDNISAEQVQLENTNSEDDEIVELVLTDYSMHGKKK